MKRIKKKLTKFFVLVATFLLVVFTFCSCGAKVESTGDNTMSVKLKSGGSARVTVTIGKDRFTDVATDMAGFKAYFKGYISVLNRASGDSDILEITDWSESKTAYSVSMDTRRIDKISGLGSITYRVGETYSTLGEEMQNLEENVLGLYEKSAKRAYPEPTSEEARTNINYLVKGSENGRLSVGVEKYGKKGVSSVDFEKFKSYLSSTEDKFVALRLPELRFVDSIRLELDGKVKYVSSECVEAVSDKVLKITPLTVKAQKDDGLATEGDGKLTEISYVTCYFTYAPDLSPLAITGIVALGVVLAVFVFCAIRFKWFSRFFKSKCWQKMKKFKTLYLMLIPGFALLVIFHYLPLGGLVTAFQDYDPTDGYGSEFIGLKNFSNILYAAKADKMYRIFRNTIFISLIRIVTNFPVILLLALFVHSIKSRRGKALFQGLSFVPYFISWTAVSGMAYALLSTNAGLINDVLVKLGMERVYWYTSPDKWWGILAVTSLWKGAGWGTLIYIAAMCNIDGELYEACALDGGGPLRQAFSVTIPSIMSVICLQLILDAGAIMKDNYEQILALIPGSSTTLDPRVEVIGKYTFTRLNAMGMGAATAMGFIQSVIGLILVLFVNKIVKKTDNEGIL